MQGSGKQMADQQQKLDAALDGVAQGRRDKLRRLIVKGAFVTPVVASFAMSGLTIERAAAAPNSTASGAPIAPPSDRRLKTGVVRLGTHPKGFGLYRFRYLWSKDEYVGVMAQEVRNVMPEAVVCGEDGFLRVDYGKIGIDMQPFAAWKAATEPSQPAAA
jgi:Chaperone of endosialidase